MAAFSLCWRHCNPKSRGDFQALVSRSGDKLTRRSSLAMIGSQVAVYTKGPAPQHLGQTQSSHSRNGTLRRAKRARQEVDHGRKNRLPGRVGMVSGDDDEFRHGAANEELRYEVLGRGARPVVLARDRK